MNDERDYRIWMTSASTRQMSKAQAVEFAYRAGHSTGAGRLADAIRLLRRVHWDYVDTGDVVFKSDLHAFIRDVDPNNLTGGYQRPRIAPASFLRPREPQK